MPIIINSTTKVIEILFVDAYIYVKNILLPYLETYTNVKSIRSFIFYKMLIFIGLNIID